MNPVQERIQTLDIIRGVAVLGIFLVNWPTLAGVEQLNAQAVYTGSNAVIRLLYDLFIQTKFYTIFSFLFGLGFYIFMQRAEAKGAKPYRLFIRRLLLLFLLGALHYILFWGGDILHTYAMSGLVLLLFYRRRSRTVLVTGIVFLTLFTLLMAAAYSSIPVSSAVTEIKLWGPAAQWLPQVRMRWHDFWNENLISNILLLPETVGLFLLGLYAGKIDLFRRANELDQKLCILQWSAFLLTLPCSYMIIRYFVTHSAYNAAAVFPYVLVSGKTLFVFYTIALLRLARQPRWQRLLQPFAFVGRMALTNYIAQTIGTVWLFRLYAEFNSSLPLVAGLIYCPLFYLLQAWWSKRWFASFAYGPLEYAWRVGTYGQRFPFRKKASQAPGL